ncbi:flagellum-specific peptidoglycan hydrolase FlgJ [Staphylococcus hominis]
MSKQKFMIYLLTTTLVLPTFTSSVAQAEENTNTKQTKTSESNHEGSTSTSETASTESNETPSSEESTSDSSDNKKQESQSKENQTDTTLNEDASSHSKSSSTHSKNNSSSNTKDEDTYHTPLSAFNINGSNPSFSSNFLSPSQYENGFSLTSLISSLFNFDDDISKYEHVESDSSSSNNSDDKHTTNTTSSDKDNTESSNQHTTTDASTQDSSDKSNSNVTSSSQSDALTENNQSNQTSHSSFKYSNDNSNHSNDDSSVSKALDSLNQLASDLNDNSTNESSTSEETTKDTASQTSKSQEEKATSESSTSHSTPSDKDGQQSEAVLDALLDQYSDKAQQTHKDYTSSKKNNTSQTSQNEDSKKDESTTQDQTSTNKDNPQLPTEKQLKHKQEAPQSFENDFKQSNTRAVSLFQDIPQLNGNNVTNGDIAVVENKETREFITSIAKDAHKIGQDNDIYASVMIAQAILESSSGNSALAQAPNYNLFGMKGSYKGATVNFNTLEAGSDNTMFSINAGFRKYPNLKASLKDYADLIKHGIDGNPTIYKSSWKDVAPTYRSATRHLSQTYATDPNYATKLNSLIDHYNLTDFDKKKMPNLDKYSKSIGSNGTDASGSAFKPFSITDGSSPYPYGQCTWYVYERVQQFGKHVGGHWGDAHNWNNSAEDASYSVSTTPKNHTAVVFEAGQSGASALYGHVAFVEKVNNDGSIIISESNVKGLGIVSYRQIDADTASSLHYIQPK